MPGFITGSLRNFITSLLALALLGALWTTSLARLSAHDSAVAMLTAAGSELINPLLVSNGSGLAQGAYGALEQSAAAHPNQPIQLLFVKPPVYGREIAGKNFADGTRAIYHDVAEAYYSGGPGAAFSLPSQLQQLVSNYSPFLQPGSSIPALPGLPGSPQSGTSSSPLPQIPLPQLPSWTAPFFRVIGITPQTITAQGHSDQLFVSRWFWIAAGVLGLLLALFGAGWSRLSSVGWAVFHSAWHITLLFVIASYLISSHPAQAAPYKEVLGLIGNAFFPVYATATIAGLVGVALAWLAPRVIKLSTRGAGASARGKAGDKPHPYETGGYVPGGQPGYGGTGYGGTGSSQQQPGYGGAGSSQQQAGYYRPPAPGGFGQPAQDDYPGPAGPARRDFGGAPSTGYAPPPRSPYGPPAGQPPAPDPYTPPAGLPPIDPYGSPAGQPDNDPYGSYGSYGSGGGTAPSNPYSPPGGSQAPNDPFGQPPNEWLPRR